MATSVQACAVNVSVSSDSFHGCGCAGDCCPYAQMYGSGYAGDGSPYAHIQSADGNPHACVTIRFFTGQQPACPHSKVAVVVGPAARMLAFKEADVKGLATRTPAFNGAVFQGQQSACPHSMKRLLIDQQSACPHSRLRLGRG